MTTRRILVVDDESAVRRVVARLLATAGYDVVEAATGEEAMTVLESEPADAVLLDLRMPGMSGQTLFHAIRSQWPTLAAVVIVMSGDPEAPEHDAWLSLHGVRVLAKPFDRATLLRTIDDLWVPDQRRAHGTE